MAIHIGTPITVRRNLADVWDGAYRLEGECKDNDRAWVECRQLTEGEVGRVEAARPVIETRFVGDEQVLKRPVDALAVRLAIARNSLVGAGNLFGKDDKEMFRFTKNGFHGGDAAFTEIWGDMHPDVAEAIVRVALIVNPRLDVSNAVYPDPFVWLQKNHPEVYDDLVKFQEESAPKNVLRNGTDD